MIEMIQGHVGATVDGIWGPKTRAAVAGKLGCANSNKAVQKAVGVEADGIIGPKSIKAIFDRFITLLEADRPVAVPICETKKEKNSQPKAYDIVLDPGHTKDYTREHPSQFQTNLWKSGKGLEVATLLRFNEKTNDSVEHILNVKLVKATAEYLESHGYNVLIYDKPELANNTEISEVYKTVNKEKPKVFVSVHNNAAGCSGAKSCSCSASGTVSFYYRQNSKKLAEAISRELIVYRKGHDGPHNRAESVINKGYTVITKVNESVKCCLTEVGFYDNMNDLWFMAHNLKGLGEAIGRAVENSL